MREPTPARAYYSHLLRPGEHYLHIDADHADLAGKLPSREATALCSHIAQIFRWARSNEDAARCIGARGQAVVERWLSMPRIYQYMAALLLEIVPLQRHAGIHKAVPTSPWFVELGTLEECIQLPRESGVATGVDGAEPDPLKCVANAVALAVRSKRAQAVAAADGPLLERDEWLS